MNDNRRKLTGILKLLYENTDAEHSMDTYQIMDALESMGYGRPDRKTIDSNIRFLIEDLGMGIRKEKGKPNRYRWIDREFDLTELKLLVDAVHSSRFINKRKCREIIAKLKDLTSIHQAATLNREIHTCCHFKRSESNLFSSVDIISEAIRTGKRVRFTLSRYDINKTEVALFNGKTIEVSPYALILDSDFYYMAGMPADSSEVKLFRVDRMKDVAIVHVDAVSAPYDFAPDKYAGHLFDMFHGELEEVLLSCKGSVMGDLIDRFGKDFYTEQTGADLFLAKVTADVNPAFFAWVFQSGGDIKIVEPESVKSKFEEMLRNQLLRS